MRNRIIELAMIVISLIACISASAETTTTTTTVVEKKIITSPPPKSVSCATVVAHWEGNVWYDSQTVCKYEGRSEGAEYVQDYWACTVANDDGSCTTWEFRPGHWVTNDTH